MAVTLTPEDVRTYIRDSVDVNYLLDGEEQFSDPRINNAISLAVDAINIIPPNTNYTGIDKLPAPTRVLVLMGTLVNLFYGESAMAARNQFSYSDGGLTVPLEERFQYWLTLAQQHEQRFNSMVKSWKIGANMDGSLTGNSWGEVRSDFSKFPKW